MDKPRNHYKFGQNPAVIQKKSRLKMAHILLFAVIFFTLLTGLFYGVNSSYFNLADVVFEGNDVLSAKELKMVFPYPLETNIWKTDLSLIENKYMSLPRVAQVEAERILPGTVSVMIEQRSTAALLPYQGNYFEVAWDGTLIEMRQELPEGGFPMLTDLSGLLYRPGENIAVSPGGELILAFFNQVQEDRIEVSELNAANPNNLTLISMEGQKVWLGREDYQEKYYLLPDILEALPSEGGYLDFRILNAPTFVTRQ